MPALDRAGRLAGRHRVRRCCGARTDDGHWEGRLSTSALSTATAVIALATAARHDSGVVAHADDSGVPSLRSRPATRRARGGVAGRARERRRRLGRHAEQPLEHLHHRARLGRAQRRAGDTRHRRRGAEGRGVADLRRRRRRRRLAAARARRALRQGPHLLGADPDGAGAAARRAPALPGGMSRSCRSSWRRRRIAGSRRCGCRW